MGKIVNGLEWVRARPAQFFGAERPRAVQLLAYLMSDVIELGHGECIIRHLNPWWMIGSDVDWLGSAAAELFQRVVVAPQHGEHSMRGEVLVGAFCSSAWIVRDHDRTRIHGEAPPDPVWRLCHGLRRAIVFAL